MCIRRSGTIGKHKAPGKAYREGLSVFELFEMFPDEESARRWFEGVRWAGGRYCGYCDSTNTREVPNEKPLPYWCTDCRQYFSVKVGTPMHRSKIPLRKWVVAIYLMTTNLKGVSSLKIRRDLNVSQPTAWFMIHRIREAWDTDDGNFRGPVEVDETYMGGKETNKHKSKKLYKGRGAVGKATVVGMRDRETNKITAEVVPAPDGLTLKEFIHYHTKPGARIFTDQYIGYKGLANHETVNHGIGQYVDGMVHTQGIESFWAMLAGRHNIRSMDTLEQMAAIAHGFTGKRLRFVDLVK